jgi:hypothetical protein
MQLNIARITCDAPARVVKDDVFLVIQADGGEPTKYPNDGALPVGPGQDLKLPDGGLIVNFSSGVCVTAFNRRFVQTNQYLFNIWVYSSTTSGTENKYNNNNAVYTITRNVLA